MNKTHPSFYLISSAVDGNINSIEKLCSSTNHTYQNAVYVPSMMNTEMSVLS